MGLKSVVVGGAITFALMSYGGAMVPDMENAFDGFFKPEAVQEVEVDLLGEELRRSIIDTQIKGLDFELAERKTRLEIVALENQILEANVKLEVEQRMADERVSQELDRAYVTSQVWLVVEGAWLLIVGLVVPLVALCVFLMKALAAYHRYNAARLVVSDE